MPRKKNSESDISGFTDLPELDDRACLLCKHHIHNGINTPCPFVVFNSFIMSFQKKYPIRWDVKNDFCSRFEK